MQEMIMAVKENDRKLHNINNEIKTKIEEVCVTNLKKFRRNKIMM